MCGTHTSSLYTSHHPHTTPDHPTPPHTTHTHHLSYYHPPHTEELEIALEHLEMDSREARKLMALADADNSESISFEEFRGLLLNTDKPNLINRMASIASVATAASPNFLARTSMTPGLARASMDPNLLRQSVAPNLFRSSMAAPSLVWCWL